MPIEQIFNLAIVLCAGFVSLMPMHEQPRASLRLIAVGFILVLAQLAFIAVPSLASAGVGPTRLSDVLLLRAFSWVVVGYALILNGTWHLLKWKMKGTRDGHSGSD